MGIRGQDKVFGQGLLPNIRARRDHPFSLQVHAVAKRRAVSHRQKHCGRESVNFIERNIWPPNIPDMNPVNRAVWRSTSEDGLSMQKFQVFLITIKSAIDTAWQVEPSQAFPRRSIGEWRRP